jgi:MYXO-CTERM domain-containing protein
MASPAFTNDYLIGTLRASSRVMLSRFTVGVVGAALAASFLVDMSDASACSCSGDPNVRPGIQDVVPVNTKIWLTNNYVCSAPTLRDDSDNMIAVTSHVLEPDIIVLSPDQALDMGATYFVHCEAGNQVAQFTVNAPADDEAPMLPTFVVGGYSRSTGSGDSCGGHEWVELEVEHDGDLTLLDVAGLADIDPVALSGSVVDMSVWVDDIYRVGEMACTDNWSFADDGPLDDVRVGSFDLAGNFSGWSTPESIDVDELSSQGDDAASSCACSVPGPTNSSGAAWLTLAALALGSTRRRRSSRHR